MTISMEERIARMKDFGAEFVADVTKVQELLNDYPPKDQIPERTHRALRSRRIRYLRQLAYKSCAER